MKKILALIALTLVFTGCSTNTYVKLPEDSVLKLNKVEDKTYTEGRVVTRPFFWSAAGGIPYKVEKNGEVLKEGKLASKFRVASIFWPPYAIIYWPMGFAQKCYDLTGATTSQCTVEEIKAMKAKAKR